jgi:hypothetical protein
MREKDYIIATNIARVRIMKDILRDILSGAEYGVGEEEAQSVAMMLRRWEAALEQKIEQRRRAT